MLFLIAVILAAVFAWVCAGALHRDPGPFYFCAALLTAVMFGIGQAHLTGIPPVVDTYVIGLFNEGALAAALWCVVAYIGAFPNGSAPVKRLMPARGELSIFAAVVTMAHAVTYSITYIRRLFSGRTPSTEFVLTCIVCLLLMVIMIPLTVLSVKAVRKKLKAKTWKSIQRAAYVFYALILVHVLVIYIPRARHGVEGALLNVIVYTAVFAGYAALRLGKLYVKKTKTERKAAVNAVCAAAAVALTVGLGVASYGKAEDVRKTADAETAPAATTVAETSASETVSETVPATTAVSVDETSATDVETEDTSETSDETSATEAATGETVTTETTTAAETTAEAAAPAEDAPAEETPVEDAPSAAPAEEVPAAEPAPQAEPEPVYVYNNGTFDGNGSSPEDYEGKDYVGRVVAHVTIENDVITGITVDFLDDDPEYYVIAQNIVLPRILDAQSPDVDAVSGATRSAEGMIEAVRNALDAARR